MTGRAALLLIVAALAVAACGRKGDPVRPADPAAKPRPPLVELPAEAQSEARQPSLPPLAGAGPVAPALLYPPSRVSPDRTDPERVDPRRVSDVFDDSI
jgi:hypothetical protein